MRRAGSGSGSAGRRLRPRSVRTSSPTPAAFRCRRRPSWRCCPSSWMPCRRRWMIRQRSQTLQRDQQRMTRQLWLSRLWFGVPPLLADVMYARIRTAIAPADSAADRPAKQRRRSHERQDRAERGGVETAAPFDDTDETPTAWAGSDRDRTTGSPSMTAASVFAATMTMTTTERGAAVSSCTGPLRCRMRCRMRFRCGSVGAVATGGRARHPNGPHRLCHIKPPGHVCQDGAVRNALQRSCGAARTCSATAARTAAGHADQGTSAVDDRTRPTGGAPMVSGAAVRARRRTPRAGVIPSTSRTCWRA